MPRKKAEETSEVNEAVADEVSIMDLEAPPSELPDDLIGEDVNNVPVTVADPDAQPQAKWGFMPGVVNWDVFKKHYGEKTLRTFFTEPPPGIVCAFSTPPRGEGANEKIYQQHYDRGYRPVQDEGLVTDDYDRAKRNSLIFCVGATFSGGFWWKAGQLLMAGRRDVVEQVKNAEMKVAVDYLRDLKKGTANQPEQVIAPGSGIDPNVRGDPTFLQESTLTEGRSRDVVPLARG